MSGFPRAERAQGLVAVAMLVSLPVVLSAVALHARRARATAEGRAEARVAVVRRMPSADLAFAGGSRHVRFLSLEEPQAAFADGPGMPDPEPAGGLVGAPRAAYADAVTRGAR